MNQKLTHDCNIVLAGPMGSGKTTVGTILAESLEREFLDTDDMIVERTGIPIARIFSERSEMYFRSLEREVVRDIANQRNLVVALGGGTIINEENRRDLENSGLVVCLVAAPDVLHDRLKSINHRPLLKGNDLRARIDEVLCERKHVYDTLKHCIATDNLAPDDVADRIIRIYKSEISSDD